MLKTCYKINNYVLKINSNDNDFRNKEFLPIFLPKRDHPRAVKRPPVRGEGNPSFAIKEKEFAITLNNQQRMSIEATSTVRNYARVVALHPAKRKLFSVKPYT